MNKTSVRKGSQPVLGGYLALKKRHQSKYRRYRKRQEEIEEQISALEEERRNMKYPHFMNTIIKPIGKAILTTLPDYRMEILGPFGLPCNVSIHFYRKGVPEAELFGDNDNCKSINFAHGDDDDPVLIRDHSTNTGRFASGTIGDLNDMNHPLVKIPDDADLEWFLQWMD